MDHEHWFDRLNKALVGATPRRTMLGAAASVVASLALGATPVAEAAKNGKKKKKNQRKGKGRPRRCGPDIHALCDGAFAPPLDTPEDRQFCKDKCERCKQAGTAFCILLSDPEDEDSVRRATCCNFADECCGGVVIGRCCTSDRCCAIDGFERCLDPGETCCPGDEAGYCQEGSACCRGGQGCQFCDPPHVLNLDTCECECPNGCDAPYVPNPDTCECECPDGLECPVECGDTQIPNPCPGLPGRCVTDQNYVCCVGHSCVIIGDDPDNYECCGVAPDDRPNTACRRFDDQRQRCALDKGYPPLATHCSRDDPVCGG
ncbi:MAG: hypothetical protein ACRDJC_09880 [Thermomicrobiales bacterium]